MPELYVQMFTPVVYLGFFHGGGGYKDLNILIQYTDNIYILFVYKFGLWRRI